MLSKLWTSYYVMCLKKDKNKNSFLRSWETVILLSFHIGTGITHWNISNHQVPQAWTLTFPGFFPFFSTLFFPFDPQPLDSISPITHFPTALPHAVFQNMGDAAPGGRALTCHRSTRLLACPRRKLTKKKLGVRVLHLLTRVFKKKKEEE